MKGERAPRKGARFFVFVDKVSRPHADMMGDNSIENTAVHRRLVSLSLMTTLSGFGDEPIGEIPRVLVVARYRNAADARRTILCLTGQTYGAVGLIFIQSQENTRSCPPDHADKICFEADFPSQLAQSHATHVLFWPEEGDLKPAAIEKLVMALKISPDCDGVADTSQGSTGLWLARRNEAMDALIQLWPGSQARWIDECQQRKHNFFFLPEDLGASTDLSTLRRPYAVEPFFRKRLVEFENYQQIPTAPLWALPAAEIDDRSVLFLVSNLPMGGACKFILDVTAQLKSHGYRVTVATTAYETKPANPWLEELLQIIPDVFVLSHTRLAEVPRQIVHLARTRRCGRVVISHSLLGYQLLPWLRSELPAVGFLDYTHIEYETEWPSGGYALRSVSNQPLLDLSLVSSEHLREWMVLHGAASEDVRVCHTNIDGEKWKPDARERARVRFDLGIDARTALILYPCRLTEQKRPELLCNIVAELRQATHAPFVVAVAGNGELMPAMKSFIAKQGLEDSFRLLGAVSLKRVAGLHNAADIFLLPSLIEGIALALFEAMALQSVPVVSDVGGQSELVTPECGCLIPLGEPRLEVAAYVTGLKRLIEDTDLRRTKAAACRQRVLEYFGLDLMTSNFITALEDAGTRHFLREPSLPSPPVCREMATLAIDHVRLKYQGGIEQDHRQLLQEQLAAQKKIVGKLHRQIEGAREARLIPEENEAHR
jgi:glycosyltransferase involved in cell wall biosynthesis